MWTDNCNFFLKFTKNHKKTFYIFNIYDILFLEAFQVQAAGLQVWVYSSTGKVVYADNFMHVIHFLAGCFTGVFYVLGTDMLMLSCL